MEYFSSHLVWSFYILIYQSRYLLEAPISYVVGRCDFSYILSLSRRDFLHGPDADHSVQPHHHQLMDVKT